MNRKKKTAKWCKGKEGVEHVSEIVKNHNFHIATCRWVPDYRARFEGVEDQFRYSCYHARQCLNCGKYTEYYLYDSSLCPDLIVPRP